MSETVSKDNFNDKNSSLPGSKGKKRKCSRTKGHSFERQIAKIFREELGYTFCKTTREGSRLLDACKVDLMHIPFLPQLKKGYDKARPKADQIFKDMKAALKEKFPKEDPIHNYPRLLIHEVDGYAEEHSLVTMTFKDWKQLVLKARKCEDKD